jgi:glycosyltransferase involved in cell wall biosynthesis
LRRGQRPKPFGKEKYDPLQDPERLHAFQADEIAAPSKAISDIVTKAWDLDVSKEVVIPHPYVPQPELLGIPVETDTGVVSFIGRLEIRKGVLDLVRAIPLVLKKHPRVRFRFVGAALPSPDRRMDMRQYLETILRRHKASLEFTGPVSPDRMPSILAEMDICVFPSYWENSPYVCLEAMAAGRGIVASSAGGMAELLDHGNAGLLAPPRSPQRVAEALIKLLDDQKQRFKLGCIARARVLSEYGAEKIVPLQEAGYVRAIQRRQALGSRKIIA